MADRRQMLKGIIGAMKSISNIQQEQNKLKMNLLENSQKFQNAYFEKMMGNQMDLAKEKEILRLKAQPEFMAPNDRAVYENQQILKGQYEVENRPPEQPRTMVTGEVEGGVGQGQVMSPGKQSFGGQTWSPVGAGDIQRSVANKRDSRVIINEKGMYEKKEPKELSTLRQMKRDKATEELFSLHTTANDTLGRVQRVMGGMQNLPKGRLGKITIKALQEANSESPILSDWQAMKDLALDLQLGKIKYTKGAVSDKEMREFQIAVGNDDLNSVARMAPVVDRILKDINSQYRTKKAAYRYNYKEDPDEILGTLTSEQGIDMPTYDKSGQPTPAPSTSSGQPTNDSALSDEAAYQLYMRAINPQVTR